MVPGIAPLVAAVARGRRRQADQAITTLARRRAGRERWLGLLQVSETRPGLSIWEDHRAAPVFSLMFEIALALEDKALEEDYFKERSLYPNVDFYSGIIYRALGIPVAMLTPIFAIARTVGWCAHWIEMMDDPEFRIFRPRQIYHGCTLRDYVGINDRG